MGNLTAGCVVMAAGNARRFGGNKLLAEIGGKSLIQRALESVPRDRLRAAAVVSQYPEVLALAEQFGFTAVENSRPDLGVSRTIRLGLEALLPCDGALFQVADQPWLRRESAAALVDLWRQRPEMIAALGHRGVRGNPCLFPARFFPELLALEGDAGGSAVIRRHPEALILLETAEEELRDVDTREGLAQQRAERICPAESIKSNFGGGKHHGQ